MLCDNCKKNTATYHSKTIINGVESSEHLCSECAKKLNRHVDFDSFDMFDIFHPSIDYDDFNLISNDLFDESYSSFDNNNQGIIGNALSSIKKGAKKYNDEKSKLDPEVEELKEKLKEAVENENYEKAAEIKKEIENRQNNKGE